MTTAQETKLKIVLAQAHIDYSVGLNKRAYFKLNNHMLAEDLVQETYIKAWNYLVKGGNINTMKAFLYKILNNLIVDEYRKNRKEVSLDILVEKGFEPSLDNSENIFNMFDGRSAFPLIRELPKKYQEILSMRFVEELSVKEISEITGQSKNTVAVQFHRGVEKLRSVYNEK